MNLSVIIPAYNESGNIESTINELHGVIKKIPGVASIQFVVVDDHSQDNMPEALGRIKDARISYMRLSKRSGSHTALRAGMEETGGDVALFISADGQEEPSCVEKMIDKWRNGTKVVWAVRKDRLNEPWYIRKSSQAFYRILSWLGGIENSGVDLSRADFFLLDRDVVEAVKKCPERNTSLFGLIAWIGFSQGYVEYIRRPRRSGASKWGFRRKIRLARDWIVAFSGLPLKLITVVGMFLALLGFLYGGYLIVNVIFGHPAPGWTSLMVAILVIGGIQMIMLGMAGEYIWRNLDESRKRPLYFIEKKSEIGNK